MAKTLMIMGLLAIAPFAVGCSDGGGTAGSGGSAGSGGTGGTAGSGGSAGSGGTGGDGGTGGGGGIATGDVTIAHLAPEIGQQMGADYLVDVYINEAAAPAIDDLKYGESDGTALVGVAPGSYTITITDGDATGPGNKIRGRVAGFEVVAGADRVVVAYRSGDSTEGQELGLFDFDNSGEALAPTEARVLVGHGADDPDLTPVNVFTATEDQGAIDTCSEFLNNFDFEDQSPRGDVVADPQDVAPGNINLVLSNNSPGQCADPFSSGLVPVTLAARSTHVVVAVDEDTGMGEDLNLWAIVDGGDPVNLTP